MDVKLFVIKMENAAGLAYWKDSILGGGDDAPTREFVLHPTDLQSLRAAEQRNRNSRLVQTLDTGTFMFCGFVIRADRAQPEGTWKLAATSKVKP
jgi:hypothetical protein